MKRIYTFIFSFAVVMLALVMFGKAIEKENNENYQRVQEELAKKDELKELHLETLNKINEHYKLDEYKSFTYEYKGDTIIKVDYMIYYVTGSNFEKTFDIVHSEEDLSKEEIEKEFELFREEVAFQRFFGKYLVNEDDKVNKSNLSFRVIKIGIILALIITVIPEIMNSSYWNLEYYGY